MKYFIKPDVNVFSTIESNFLQGWVNEVSSNFPNQPEVVINNIEKKSYTCFNYYGSALASTIKLEHFEVALSFAKPYFQKSNVVDLGCADGIFLPSLSKYFKNVVAIDYGEDFIRNTNQVVNKLNLKNVSVFCNKHQTLKDISQQVKNPSDIIFSLEVLEHVGKRETMYQDKLNFLIDASNLLKPDGIFIISVPQMVGFSFFLQRLGIRLMRIHTEPISWKNFINAVLFKKTDALEQFWWSGGHIGFNHNKFERKIKESFEVVKKKKTIFQVFYILKKK